MGKIETDREMMVETEVTKMDLSDQVVFKFACKLACNEQSSRSRGLKQLHLFLKKLPESVEEVTLLRLWKGMHYCMWMADKPLFQEQLASRTAGLLAVMDNKTLSMRFFAAFVRLEALEWHLIDTLRLDKFMMLVRLVLREVLLLLKAAEWDEVLTQSFTNTLRSLVVGDWSRQGDFGMPGGMRKGVVSRGLVFHMLEILMGEVEKVLSPQHPKNLIDQLMKTFIKLVSTSPDQYIAREVKKNVLYKLTNPIFKVDLQVYEEDIFKVASKAACLHRPLLYTLLKQIGVMKQSGGEKMPGKKEMKRNMVEEDDFEEHVEKAVERLKQYEMSLMLGRKGKRQEKKMAGQVVPEGDHESDEDDNADRDDIEDDATEVEEVIVKKILKKKKTVKKINGFVKIENEVGDKEDDEENDDMEDDDEGEEEEDDDDEEEDDDEELDNDISGFLDIEADDDEEDDIEDEFLDDEDEVLDDDVLDNKDEVLDDEDEKENEIIVNEKKNGRKRRRSEGMSTPKLVAVKATTVASSEKKSVVFNKKCLAKKFHQHTRVTPKFDPTSKPLRSALKSSSLPRRKMPRFASP